MQALESKSTNEINWDDSLPRLILYSLHLIRLYGLEERVSAEDVALSAIERAMKYPPRPLQNYSTFLMRVAKNIINDKWRKREREESPADRVEPSMRVASLPDMQLQLEREELREILTGTLLEAARGEDKLAKLTRALLENPPLSPQDIAEKLGVSIHELHRLKNVLYHRVRKAMTQRKIAS